MQPRQHRYAAANEQRSPPAWPAAEDGPHRENEQQCAGHFGVDLIGVEEEWRREQGRGPRRERGPERAGEVAGQQEHLHAQQPGQHHHQEVHPKGIAVAEERQHHEGQAQRMLRVHGAPPAVDSVHLVQVAGVAEMVGIEGQIVLLAVVVEHVEVAVALE